MTAGPPRRHRGGMDASPDPRPPAARTVGAAEAVALAGFVAYLSSLADEPTAIPLVGTVALLLSLVGLVVTGLQLLRR